MASRPDAESKAPGIFDEGALIRWVEGQGYPASVASKVYRAVVPGIKSGGGWDEIFALGSRPQLQLPPILPSLRREFVLFTSRIVETLESTNTTKHVIELRSGHRVESVVMRHEDRTTVCVSSQVGCQMGCTFCATGTMGILADLTACEIVEQVAFAGKVRNVVFMGMGEPLMNYDNVTKAVEMLTASGSWELRRKSVTISTVGVPNFRKLSREFPEVQVALSLHAPTQALRECLVPAARAMPMPKLMEALDEHLVGKKYPVMLEYVLLKDVNDQPEHAEQLVELLKARNVMVNLIPYNPNLTAETYGYEQPSKEATRAFGARLVKRGLRVRERKEFGSEIAAACGQLALPLLALLAAAAAGAALLALSSSSSS
ncbi:hypothetical protein CTAYLR_007732 [Chrysophaeum taylorii]|uniref:Radical SAM core domain-containing protein n=1 Tax=Chrysophaeum taylorii TaxID=2483200 RepID=A0AAD7XQT9_9STRA|nr:hypothetical protein CTAYLR_007732 [Chrysophaeum taylorii]